MAWRWRWKKQKKKPGRRSDSTLLAYSMVARPARMMGMSVQLTRYPKRNPGRRRGFLIMGEKGRGGIVKKSGLEFKCTALDMLQVHNLLAASISKSDNTDGDEI